LWGDLIYFSEKQPLKVLRYWALALLLAVYLRKDGARRIPLFVRRKISQQYGAFNTSYSLGMM